MQWSTTSIPLSKKNNFACQRFCSSSQNSPSIWTATWSQSGQSSIFENAQVLWSTTSPPLSKYKMILHPNGFAAISNENYPYLSELPPEFSQVNLLSYHLENIFNKEILRHHHQPIGGGWSQGNLATVYIGPAANDYSEADPQGWYDVIIWYTQAGSRSHSHKVITTRHGPHMNMQTVNYTGF